MGEEAYSGDISISVGSDQGSVVLYYCPPELERQPNLEEEKIAELGKLQFRPGEVFIIMLFWDSRVFLLWSDANSGQSPVKVNTTLTKISKRNLRNKNWG